MYPAIGYELARAADLSRQAQRDALARNVGRARHARRQQPRHVAPGFLTAVTARYV